jgi:4-hydroxythreonine-4-phosphate dehydrogenase
VADPQLLKDRAASLGLPIELELVGQTAQELAHRAGVLQVLPVALDVPCQAGVLNKGNAAYVIRTLQAAVDGYRQQRFDALVTGPVQKSVINDAGIAFTGHTEFLAEATGTASVVMMLATRDMRVALATTHLPLAMVPTAITRELIEQSLQILHRDLVTRFGLTKPRIAVLGLNPHAGEGGHMGREEIDIIIPALQKMKDTGMDLLGPLPADTAFNPAILEQVDAVFAMYHDQGLPVLKHTGFGSAVNITLGLPLIRTSVDHGTALDLAGSGEADPGSLLRAIEVATAMCGQSC